MLIAPSCSLIISIYCINALILGCAVESGNNSEDGGNKDIVGSDNSSYPPPPYGTQVGATIENLSLEECICSGEQPEGRKIALSDFLGTQALLITVHSGWCENCETQALGMESNVYQAYKSQGFEILLVIFQDKDYNSGREILLNYCCKEYKEKFGMTFNLAIDPGGAKMVDTYFSKPPLNMLVDQQMVIQYKSESYSPDELDVSIKNLLGID